MQTLQRPVDDEGERDGVSGEIETTNKGHRRVGVRYGQTLAAEDNVGTTTKDGPPRLSGRRRRTSARRPGTVHRDCLEQVDGRQRRQGRFVRLRQRTADRSLRRRRRRRGRRRASPAEKVYAV